MQKRHYLIITTMLANLSRHLRKMFAAGLFILIPVVITYLLLKILFDSIDGVLKPTIGGLINREIPGLGLIALIILVYLSGLLSANILGRKLISFTQSLLLRTPIVRAVYSSARLLIESFSGTSTTGFKRVVMIEHPRKGLWSIGFLTGLTKNEKGQSLAIVYIPTAPTPNSGFVTLLPLKEVRDTDLSVQTAMSLVLSGGINTPDQINSTPLS